MIHKNSLNRLLFTIALILILNTILTGCGGGPTNTGTPSTGNVSSISPLAFENANLNGAGATFPAPLYFKWFDVYFQATGTKINYQAVGSGAGMQQIANGTVDFGASDAMMTPGQQETVEKTFGPILHIPMTSGAVAIIYNLNGIDSGQIKLSGEVLAEIYLKNILKWNDPAIVALNPGLSLPDSPIAVVHRSDGSWNHLYFH